MTPNNYIEQINALNLAFSATEQRLMDEIAAITDREQKISEKLLEVQHQVEQQKVEQSRLDKEYEEALHKESVDREYVVNQQLQLRQELQHLEQERIAREKYHAEKSSQSRQELEALLHSQTQHEQEVATHLLAAEKAIQEKAELARIQSEHTRALDEQHNKQQQLLHEKLHLLHEQLHLLQQERVTREKVLLDRTDKAKQEIEDILRSQVRREQDIAVQLLSTRDQAEREKSELIRDYVKQERAMRSLQDIKEKEHEEQAARARLEFDTILRQQVLREQDVLAQLLEVQQQAKSEKAALVSSQSEQLRALQALHVEREQLLNERLLINQQELHQQHQAHSRRAQESAEKLRALALEQQAAEIAIKNSHEQSENERKLHHIHAEREEYLKKQLLEKQSNLYALQELYAKRTQELSEQIFLCQEQAAQELAEQAQKHLQQTNALQLSHSEKEIFLTDTLQVTQKDLLRLQQEWAQREEDYEVQIRRHQEELEGILRSHTKHEQEVNSQLLTAQQQVHQEKSELKRLQDAWTAFEEKLKAEVLFEKQTSLLLRQTLDEVRDELLATHTSLTWRITSPLRQLISLIIPQKHVARRASILNYTADLGNTATMTPSSVSHELVSGDLPKSALTALNQTSNSIHAMELNATSMAVIFSAAESSSIDVQHAPSESNMLPPAQSKALPTPTPATTLDELLSHHDKYFIQCAYKTILGRLPDPVGLRYYLRRLQSGISKIQILEQLYFSDEGKIYASKLPGLSKSILHYQKARYPIIGWIFARINGVEGNGAIDRKLRAIENQIYFLTDESSRRFNQVDVALSSLHQLVTQSHTAMGSMADSYNASVMDSNSQSLQSDDTEMMMRISPRARDIYFQLKKAVAINAGRNS